VLYRIESGISTIKDVLKEVITEKRTLKNFSELDLQGVEISAQAMIEQWFWNIDQARSFIKLALQDCGSILEQEPVLIASGRYEEKPLAPRTYADMQNEVAANLVNLPLYTAKVKITADGQIAEHTIKTLDPKQQPDKPLYGQALQDRLERMKKQNIQDGYLRERAKVEAEIRSRQEQCSQMPRLPGQPPKLPEDEPPPISRREDR
jgi:hypothetical protein